MTVYKCPIIVKSVVQVFLLLSFESTLSKCAIPFTFISQENCFLLVEKTYCDGKMKSSFRLITNSEIEKDIFSLLDQRREDPRYIGDTFFHQSQDTLG